MAQPIALIAGPGKGPRFVQGLGLPYLAAVLEQAGFEPRIFDTYPASPDTDDPQALDAQLATAIAETQPSIVGMTIHTPEYAARVRLARFIRERLPHALLVAGGHHPTAQPAHLLRNSDFDVCAIGEAEGTLLEVAQQVARGATRSDIGRLSGVHGVAYVQGDRVTRTQPRALVGDVDGLPFPAHHLLGLADYTAHPHTGVKSTGIVTYRGCPKQCVFCCNLLGPDVRLRDPVTVVHEMAQVGRDHDVYGFNVYDNLFGLDRDHALAMCEEIIRRGLDIVWDCWTAGDLVDAELAVKMKAAGCVRVGFGAESGDDEVLMKAQRGFTSGQHRAGIAALKAAGLKVEALFMIGLPGESANTARHTVEFAANCGADEVCLSLHRPWPGTAVWGAPEAFGVRITCGPDFEAYIETEALSRSALLECTENANERLLASGLSSGILRCDRYGWE